MDGHLIGRLDQIYWRPAGNRILANAGGASLSSIKGQNKTRAFHLEKRAMVSTVASSTKYLTVRKRQLLFENQGKCFESFVLSAAGTAS
jgi:hypothetical protein